MTILYLEIHKLCYPCEGQSASFETYFEENTKDDLLETHNIVKRYRAQKAPFFVH